MEQEQREKMIFSLNGFGNERLLRVEEVAVRIGSSLNTINNWYRFKRENPDDKYARLLPDFYQFEGPRQTRYWKESDIPRLLDFKTTIPKGCNGIMGSVTQRYYKKRKKESDGQE
jgi:hypothetical protein